MKLNTGNQWQQVTCRECGRTYQCTPEDDYYGTAECPVPGPAEGACFRCLLIIHGDDPDATRVLVIDETGAELDPRDLAVRENFEATR